MQFSQLHFQLRVQLKKLLTEGHMTPRAEPRNAQVEESESKPGTLSASALPSTALGASKMQLETAGLEFLCILILTFQKAVQAFYRKKCGKQRRMRPGFLSLLAFCCFLPVGFLFV